LSNPGTRVVVTGLGAITPIGTGVQSFWNNLLGGKSGISEITLFDASEFGTRIAGEIHSFDPLDHMDKMDARKYDRFTQFSLVATEEAVRDSGIKIESVDPFRAGVIIGSGIGGLQTLVDQYDTLREKGPRRVSPFLIPAMIPNMASGLISIKYGLHGPNMCTVSACASANHAIGEAIRYIQRGEADVMLCGGAEAPIVDLGVAGFVSMKALSTRNDEPERASRPFDVDRDGFVIGEGAATLVLEDEGHAKKRGARIYAVLSGYGISADAHHVAAPEPSGLGARRCMENAVRDAGLGLTDIEYIHAHGTATPPGDRSEVSALRDLFGDHVKKLMISSNKSMIGHLLGAAGGVETLATVLTVNTGMVPPTVNLDHAEFDLDFVPHRFVERDIGTAINNSFGFGGHNASLVVTRYE
jgi:3-oxoacyl-[acyl-carrier-protein] synthase II